MKRLSIISTALVALVGSAVGLCAAESETFTGTAARSGTYKRPLLIVDADECFILMGARHSTVSEVVFAAKYRTEEPNTLATGFYGVVLGALSQDNLVTGCDFQTGLCLNLNVNALANGNVHSSIRTLYPRFDHHAGAPYENLYTDIVLTKGGAGST
jgi:hypothetical protein